MKYNLNKKNGLKILVIGDLTTANNYGAIATSEALKKILREKAQNSVIKYIDYRSFRKPTPASGWENSSPIEIRIRQHIKKIRQIWPITHIFNFCVKKFKDRSTQIHPHIPPLFKYYDKYAQNVLSEKVLKYEYKLLKWCDLVCVNAEGNIVKGTNEEGFYRPGALYILFLMYFAKKYLNKHCVVINHTVDPHNKDAEEIISKVYPELDFIAVREPYSLDTLKKIGVTKRVNLIPDALFSYSPKRNWEPSKALIKEINFFKKYICIGDSSGILSETNCVKWNVYRTYLQLIIELKKICSQIIFIDGFEGGHPQINKLVHKMHLGRINLLNCSYKDLYHVLANAEIFISGRYHASILSVMGGTPILLWGADSHKTKGLYAILNYPYKFFNIETLPLHLDEVVEETSKILSKKEEIRQYLFKKTKELKKEVSKRYSFLNNVI